MEGFMAASSSAAQPAIYASSSSSAAQPEANASSSSAAQPARQLSIIGDVQRWLATVTEQMSGAKSKQMKSRCGRVKNASSKVANSLCHAFSPEVACQSHVGGSH